DRTVGLLNVPVEQRVRFAVFHLKTTLLIPPLRHWASFPACALVRCGVNNNRCGERRLAHKKPTLPTFRWVELALYLCAELSGLARSARLSFTVAARTATTVQDSPRQ